MEISPEAAGHFAVPKKKHEQTAQFIEEVELLNTELTKQVGITIQIKYESSCRATPGLLLINSKLSYVDRETSRQIEISNCSDQHIKLQSQLKFRFVCFQEKNYRFFPNYASSFNRRNEKSKKTRPGRN
jgi:hypothetical protein